MIEMRRCTFVFAAELILCKALLHLSELSLKRGFESVIYVEHKGAGHRCARPASSESLS